ncbi:MAG: DUF2262 domain-containing protein [Polyangiales bacterium]
MSLAAPIRGWYTHAMAASDDSRPMTPQEHIAAQKKRRQALEAAFESAEAIDILGVVAASGSSGSRFGGMEDWCLGSTLEVWRVEGGELETAPLRLERYMPEHELEAWRARLRPYAIVRVRARLVRDPLFRWPHARLESVSTEAVADPELEAHATRLQAPVVFEDPELGRFELQRAIRWFAGNADWLGPRARLTLRGTELEEVRAAADHARRLRASWHEWVERLTQAAARELLSVKNAHWLEDDEEPMSEAAFRACMTPESLGVEADGSFNVFFDDGGIFAGHAIVVYADLAKGPTRVNLYG